MEAATCEDQLSASCEVYTDSNNVSLAYRVYYEAINMDQFGNITKDQFHDSKLTTIRNYNPTDGIMENTCIDASPTDDCSADEQDKLLFGFDKLGNLISKSDKSGTESFAYDELNRLSTETRIIGASNQTLSYDYTANGNLTLKGGDILSYNGSQPHAVSNFKGTSFIYDANGNMTASTSGNFQRSIDYSGLSKAYYIHNDNNNKASYFIYDANHNRQVRKDSQNNMRTKTTHYIGNVEMIKSANNGDIETYKRYIGPLIIDMPSLNASQLNWKYNYQLKDHLGSSHSIITLRSNGVQTESLTLSFDAWGQRRWVDSFAVSDINAGDTQFSNVIDKTTRGYTGHEHLDEVGIIHMNGRIYSAYLGRFLQADPIIQDPFDTQSLNRYTYVGNNPLSLSDPTGYYSVDAFMNNGGRQLIAAIITIVVPNAFIAGTLSGAVTGGTKGAVVGAFSSAAFHGIGSYYEGLSTGAKTGFLKTGLSAGQYAGKVALHGLVGGAGSLAMGGKFGHGFASAGVTQAASPVIDLIQPGASGAWLRVVTAAIVGGTVSHLTGGKFANGALTGAWSRAFNDEYEDFVENDKDYAELKFEMGVATKKGLKVGFDQDGLKGTALAKSDKFKLEFNSNQEAALTINGSTKVKFDLSTDQLATFKGFLIKKDLKFASISGGFNNNGDIVLSAKLGFNTGPFLKIGTVIDPVGLVLSNFKKPARWFNMEKTRKAMCENGLGCN